MVSENPKISSPLQSSEVIKFVTEWLSALCGSLQSHRHVLLLLLLLLTLLRGTLGGVLTRGKALGFCEN